MLSAKVQILIDEIFIKWPYGLSRVDFWFFIAELVTRDPNLGIPALEDELFANLLFFKERGKEKGREKGREKKREKGKGKGPPLGDRRWEDSPNSLKLMNCIFWLIPFG